MQGWISLPHTTQRSKVKGHCQGHHKEQENMSSLWFITVQAAMTAHLTCSSWTEDSDSYIPVAWLVVLLTAPYSKTSH